MSQVGNKKHWRSFEALGSLSNQKPSAAKKQSEFPEGANKMTGSISRREFFKLAGAGTALMGLSGCGVIRRPKKHLYPYSSPPEHVVPGEALYYATSYPMGEDVAGLLVETHEGRPTKVEGNPLHPTNKGKTSAFHQASILDLYDPDRLQQYLHHGSASSKALFLEHISKVAKAMERSQGEGYAVLSERIPSPTHYRLLSALQKKYPKLLVGLYNPIHFDHVYEGMGMNAHKDRPRPRRVGEAVPQKTLQKIDFRRTDLIVSFNSDFLSQKEPFFMENARGFAARRDPDHPRGMNRLIQFESHFTLTGAKADHRYAVRPSLIEPLIYKLLVELFDQKNLKVTEIDELIKSSRKTLPTFETEFEALGLNKVIKALAKELPNYVARCVFTAGAGEHPVVHALVDKLNSYLWSDRVERPTITHHESPFEAFSLYKKGNLESISELAAGIRDGSLKKLIVLGGDPAYNAPGDLRFDHLVKKVETIHLTSHLNATSKKAFWAVPRSHTLERWGDAVSLDGHKSLGQPLIAPMYDSLSEAELLSHLLQQPEEAINLVRATWTDLSDAEWKKSLHNGVITDSRLFAPKPRSVTTWQIERAPHFERLASRQRQVAKNYSKNALEVAVHSDYTLYDGRFANNGWLQELPDPITKIAWDNPIVVSPKTADKLGLKNNDVVRLAASQQKTLEGAIYILPGHADDCVSVFLGSGQLEHQGKLVPKTGYNAYRFKDSKAKFTHTHATLEKTGDTYELASVQEHWTIDEPNGSSQNGRPLFLETDLANYKKNPDFARERVEVPSLPEHHERRTGQKSLHPMHGNQMSIFPQRDYTTGYQWGMSIDLSQCIGCNACMVACQSENNIPIVGKKQVLEGREMHWIRLDRYFEGEPNNPKMVIQPVTCLHCETAPCEQVCPVAATTHSSEGTNDMAYNRCIGTRFCSNNCPVKVRRFNFLDYHQTNPQSKKKVRSHLFDLIREPRESIQMLFNPNVTVRMRGVMEKCTYCIQRVSKAKIKAKLNQSTVGDKDLQSACQQACPSGAIAFGDINNPKSEVSGHRRSPRNYHLLPELNLKPRTTYLASVRNPSYRMEPRKGPTTSKTGGHGH